MLQQQTRWFCFRVEEKNCKHSVMFLTKVNLYHVPGKLNIVADSVLTTNDGEQEKGWEERWRRTGENIHRTLPWLLYRTKNIVPLYFWAGIMLSMASPFSSFFSISTINLTPSTTNWTCSTSEEPRRSALEMSNTPPTEAVSTPPGRRNNGQDKAEVTMLTSHWLDSRTRRAHLNLTTHVCGLISNWNQHQTKILTLFLQLTNAKNSSRF